MKDQFLEHGLYIPALELDIKEVDIWKLILSCYVLLASIQYVNIVIPERICTVY